MTAVRITETEPVSIVKDFDTFVNYLKEHNPPLVRKGHLLPKKTLYEIEQLMSHPDPESTPKTAFMFYPRLKLFYYSILRGNLFIKTRELTLHETGRLTEYEGLTPTEKYFFLLETFWVDSFWGELMGERASSYLIPGSQAIIEYLAKMQPGKITFMRDMDNVLRTLSITMSHFNKLFLFQYLSVFGLVQLTYEEQEPLKERRLRRVDTVTVTDLGRALLPVLASERNLEQWNIPYMREETSEFVIFPGKDQEYEPFFKPFQGLFKEELKRTLPRGRKHTGSFVFKVSVKRSVWRTIKTSSEHTFEDLHLAIQDAFAFDKDHLYAFFMEGIPWSWHVLYAPGTDEGPYADQVRIGDVELWSNQRFLYLFDFGDEWHFIVEVLEVSDEPGPASPEIVEKKGTSPEQYCW